MQPVTRRHLLTTAVFGAATLAALTACGAPAAPTTAPTKPADKPAAGATPAPAGAAAPAKGAKSLRVAINATQQRAQQLTDFGKSFQDKNGIAVEWTPI